MSIHSLYKILRQFPRPKIESVASALEQGVENYRALFKPGQSVAVAVGSRGIADIDVVVKNIVMLLTRLGVKPFIIPAMGSHGGATAQGQRDVLDSYGINESTMGVPIISSMEVVEIESGETPNKTFMDSHAFHADGVVLVNRIKPHTDYHGLYESGLVKMSVIGLGKHAQALEIHRYGVYGLRELVPLTARKILSAGKIMIGVAIVENAHDEIMHLEVMSADEIMTKEPELLTIAKDNMASLPVRDIDVLIVDRLGKDISGVGMDPNIIGRIRINGETEPYTPRIKNIIVTDLTEKSHGNGLGIGLADVITKRLYNKINFRDMYENVFTSTFLERAKIPIIADSDQEAFRYATRSCGLIPEGQERIMRISDTLHLSELYVSQSILREIEKDKTMKITSESVPLFDSEGALLPF